MARPRKSSNTFVQINLSESYMSLFLGLLVVLVAIIFIFFFTKNKLYDKINTAVFTHQEQIQNSPKTEPKTYEIKAGDNLWKIAENVYGSGYNWVDIAKANNLQNPGLLFRGNKLIIPDVPKITVATVPAEGEARQGRQSTQINGPSISSSDYKVVKGDNLWDIAVRKYGDGFKWTEIAKVNNIQTPDLIYPDNTLKLP